MALRIGLVAEEFINNDIEYNKNIILNTLIKVRDLSLDFICFGEAFLQGFDSFAWKYEIDKNIAISMRNEIIQEIQKQAKEVGVGVCFGYLELDDGYLYCSYLLIGKDGKIVHNYKRTSKGWKEPIADEHYKEGKEYPLINYLDYSFCVGLCGDFWDEEMVKSVHEIKKDFVLWPLYVNYSCNDFNQKIKKEYLNQASLFGDRVLYINSFSKNPDAFGGCYDFKEGKIVNELPMGEKGILIVEV